MSSKKSDLVRIDPEDKKYFEALAEETKQSMPKVIHAIVEQHRIKKFFEEYDASYAALRNNKKAWQQELKERAIWERTLSDGAEDR